MSEEPRPAAYLSTPMIKGELLSLLSEIRPNKKWPKKPKLQDIVEFAIQDLRADDDDPRIVRARVLAQAINHSERR